MWFADLGPTAEAATAADDSNEAQQQPRGGQRRRRRKKSSFLRFLEQVVVQKDIRTEAGRAAFREVSPLWLLERCAAHAGGGLASIPPILGVHGDNDYLVPVEDSRHFYRRLRELRGRRADAGGALADVFVELEGAHHAFGLMTSPRSFALADAATLFLNAAVGRNQQGGDGGGGMVSKL